MIWNNMFNLDLIEFAPLNRIDGADRLYETPGGSYPSVTTVLDKTKTFLIKNSKQY